jgi:hypothetical protein
MALRVQAEEDEQRAINQAQAALDAQRAIDQDQANSTTRTESSERMITVLDRCRANLSDPDRSIRCTAAMDLSHMGRTAAPAIPELTAALKDDDPVVRRLVVDALGCIGRDAQQVIRSLQAMLEDQDPDVKGAATVAIWRVDPSASGAWRPEAESRGSRGLVSTNPAETTGDAVYRGLTWGASPEEVRHRISDAEFRFDAPLGGGEVAQEEIRTFQGQGVAAGLAVGEDLRVEPFGLLVVVLAAGLALSGVGNIVNVTVGALVFYGLGRLALLASQGVPLGELPGRGWDSLKTMQVNELAVYFLAFAVII